MCNLWTNNFAQRTHDAETNSGIQQRDIFYFWNEIWLIFVNIHSENKQKFRRFFVSKLCRTMY